MLFDFDGVAESAAKVAYHNFKWQYATLILFNATIFYGVDIFAKLYNKNLEFYNIMNNRQENDPRFVDNAIQFVSFANDITDILIMLDALKTQKINTNAKFIIICHSENNCDENNAVKIFWSYRIVNVILIKHDNSLISGYTYFQNERCGESIPRRLEHWDECIYSNRDEACKTKMFPMKFKNFHRCPLVVSTFPQVPYMFIKNGVPYGADGDLLRIIAEALNSTLVLSPRNSNDWGILENNQTWTGSFGDIYYDLANFSMTSASITLNRFKYFDMSMYYNTIALVWVTHPSNLESSSLKLLKPFTRGARISIILIFLIVILIHIFLKTNLNKRFSERFNVAQSSDYFLMDTLQISIGLPTTRFPTKYFLKYLMLFWICYWCLIRTFYQVYLINSLQNDVRVNNVMTIREAMEKGYHFGGGLALKDYYKEDPLIYDNWIVVQNDEFNSVLLNLTRGMKFVLTMNSVTAKLFRKKTHFDLHILPEEILESPTLLYFKKYSCLTRAINLVLNRLVEAGIPSKLFRDYTFEYKSVDNSYESIKFEHFRGCFGILILGSILSTLVFIIEKLVEMLGNASSIPLVLQMPVGGNRLPTGEPDRLP